MSLKVAAVRIDRNRRGAQLTPDAAADIREELGPEFKDFEFEDLNPKTFIMGIRHEAVEAEAVV